MLAAAAPAATRPRPPFAGKYPTPRRIGTTSECASNAVTQQRNNATTPTPSPTPTHQASNFSILGNHHEYPIIKRLDEQLGGRVADESAELERRDWRGEGAVGNGGRLGDGVGFFEERRHGEGAAGVRLDGGCEDDDSERCSLAVLQMRGGWC